MRRRRKKGARAAGREGGIIETGKIKTREARRAGFRDMEERKRKAGGGFLGVGACRREDGPRGGAARKADK